MEPALTITELNNLAQYPDHDLIVLLFLINLVCYKSDQTTLLRIQFDCIDDTSENNLGIKRSADIIRNAHIVCLLNVGRRIITGYHNNRNIFNPVITVYLDQDFKAIHHRHIDIQQNK